MSRHVPAALLLGFALCAVPRAWCLDGARIVFGSSLAGESSLYVTTPNGGKFEKLGDTGIDGRYPAWSPDGRMVALQHPPDEEGVPTGIYVVGADGDALNEVSDGPWSYDPTWAPGGDRVAYASTRAGVKRHSIYVSDVRRGGEQQLTVPGTVAYHPSWRPSGNRIAYVQITDGVSDMHVMDDQGRHLAQLTDDGDWESRPSWHPRGTRIAFSSGGEDEGHGDIYTMNADGSDRRRLTAHAASDMDPIWSPDGRYILFTSTRDARRPEDGGICLSWA